MTRTRSPGAPQVVGGVTAEAQCTAEGDGIDDLRVGPAPPRTPAARPLRPVPCVRSLASRPLRRVAVPHPPRAGPAQPASISGRAATRSRGATFVRTPPPPPSLLLDSAPALRFGVRRREPAG